MSNILSCPLVPQAGHRTYCERLASLISAAGERAMTWKEVLEVATWVRVCNFIQHEIHVRVLIAAFFALHPIALRVLILLKTNAMH